LATSDALNTIGTVTPPTSMVSSTAEVVAL